MQRHKGHKMEFTIGLNSISSYKRLSYTAWHALAEFVDNSTQSYFDNRESLDRLQGDDALTPLKVSIDYSRKKDSFEGIITITDNAMGMSAEELERAMQVARPPANTTGRSRYGMGLKTAACWMGNKWKVKTKKLGHTVEYRIEVNVDMIANEENELDLIREENRPVHEHYTVVEITDHNQVFHTRTISKIKDFLSSMYREDFRQGILTLSFGEETLSWKLDNENQFLTSREGKLYRKEFRFPVVTEEKGSRYVFGWVGILKSGSRARAGFSVLHAKRVIQGYPDSWRPTSLYGQIQGSNDLINQRLIGEIHLDNFEVSHTKDQIVWLDDEDEQVNIGLRRECGEFREIARQHRKKDDDQRGPTEVMVDTAISQLKNELASKQLRLWVSSDLLLTNDIIRKSKETYVNAVVNKITVTFTAQVTDELLVRGYVEEMSVNDPYLAIDRPTRGKLDVIINKAHLHWYQLKDTDAVLNFLRHCVYDGIAEYRAQDRSALSLEILPDTIKLLKDKLLRIPFEIEQDSLEASIGDDAEEVDSNQ